MAISRADLLKELLPGINEMFKFEYKTPKQRSIDGLIEQVLDNERLKNYRRLTDENNSTSEVSTADSI
jgi:hypothetical protein